MYKFLLIALLFVLSLHAKDLEKVSVQLLWKHQFEFAGFYMAKEKGFYKDINLDVQLKEYDFNTDIIKDVESQKSTFGVAYPGILLDIANGSKVTLLNAIYQLSPHVFVALQSSNINSIQDFKNKTIMMDADTIKAASLLAMLYANHISKNDFSTVSPSFNIQDLIDKKVDIFSVYLSNEIFKLKEKNIAYNIFNPKDYGFDIFNDLLFTSTVLTKTNPKLVKKFQEATLKGYKYAFNHMDETVNIILKKYNTQKKSKQALQHEAKILSQLAYYKTDTLGVIEEASVQRVYDLYALMGIKTKKTDIKKMIFKYKKDDLNCTKEEKAYLKKQKTITYCIDPYWMPYEQIEKGKHVGISADFLQFVGSKYNLHFKLIPTKSWNESLQFIKERKCDILSLAMETKKRKEYLNFTSPYLEIPLVIATQQNVQFISNYTMLRGKKLAIPKGYAFIEILKEKYPFLDIIEVKNITEGLDKVASGDVFGYIGTLASIGYAIQNNYLSELKINGKFNDSWDLGIAVRNDDPILLNILNKIVQNIDKQKQREIINKWISVEYKEVTNYDQLYKVLGIVLIIILFLIYRQYVLRKSNNKLHTLVDEKTKELQLLNQGLEEKIKKAVAENTNKDMLLAQQSKMASMGEMIGNIAHQWRQPLSLVSTLSTGILFKLEAKMSVDESEIIETMNKMNTTAQYLSQTIDDFQDFLKPTQSKEEFNISNTIHQTIDMFGASFSTNDIDFVLDVEDIYLNNNQNALLQVVINILNNAKDALKDSNEENRYIFITLKKDKNNAILKITDTAGGIPKEIQDKIFEAYFTTKHQSQGTGLGLYMSYQIISNTFNGTLIVSNEAFEYKNHSYTGAQFTISIPLEE